MSCRKSTRMNSCLTYQSSGSQITVTFTRGNELSRTLRVNQTGEVFLRCNRICDRLWAGFKQFCNKQGEMPEEEFKALYNQYKAQINQMARVRNFGEIKQFLCLTDPKRINRDEQLNVIQLLKHRMEETAQQLLKSQNYHLYSKLMVEIRTLDSKIVKWQDQARTNFQLQERSIFQLVKEKRLQHFYNRWENQFSRIEEVKAQSRQNLLRSFKSAQKTLFKNEFSNGSTLKVKHKIQLSDYIFEERLMSMNQRVYEAQSCKRSVQKLSKLETKRVEEQISRNYELKKQQLANEFAKNKNYQQQRLDFKEDKLIASMRKEYQVLLKEMNMHQHQIERLQVKEKQFYNRLGTLKPELDRRKKLTRSMNQVLQQKRRGLLNPIDIDSIDQPSALSRQPVTSRNPVLQRKISRGDRSERLGAGPVQLLDFKLTKPKEEEKPVNKSFTEQRTVDRYLCSPVLTAQQLANISLCKMYDQDLAQKPGGDTSQSKRKGIVKKIKALLA